MTFFTVWDAAQVRPASYGGFFSRNQKARIESMNEKGTGVERGLTNIGALAGPRVHCYNNAPIEHKSEGRGAVVWLHVLNNFPFKGIQLHTQRRGLHQQRQKALQNVLQLSAPGAT
jgi:hypothetical protein